MLGSLLFPALSKRIAKLENEVARLESKLNELTTSPIGRLNQHLAFIDTGNCVTVQLSGVNLQIVNGEGSTESKNCKGNLIIGYNEPPPGGETPSRGGSHNLIMGTRHHYASYCGFINGIHNSITAGGEYCVILNGFESTANVKHVSICNGTGHQANGVYSTILSGFDNGGTGEKSVVLTGTNNRANGGSSVILNGGGETTSSGGQIIPAIP